MKVDEAKALELAWAAARTAAHDILSHWEKGLDVSQKRDGSLVTQADHGAEKVIRRILQEGFPDIPVVGEEQGGDLAASQWKWVVDPIDSTKNFVRGIPLYGVLIGLVKDEESRVGVVYIPPLREGIRARKGGGCHDSRGRALKVSEVSSLEESFLTHGELKYFLDGSREKGFHRTAKACQTIRGFGDFYGHTWVMRGCADAMLDPIVKPWDVAAIKVCVEEAGGRFTDLDGNDTFLGGSALASNAKIHDEILKSLNG